MLQRIAQNALGDVLFLIFIILLSHLLYGDWKTLDALIALYYTLWR